MRKTPPETAQATKQRTELYSLTRVQETPFHAEPKQYHDRVVAVALLHNELRQKPLPSNLSEFKSLSRPALIPNAVKSLGISPITVDTAKKSENLREISFADAIREATDQEMERDERVILFGLDVDDPKAILETTKGLAEKFGSERVFGTPLSEDAMTGIAVGAALAGLRPIHVHIRMDFLMLAMNQLVNVAAKSRYMYGGQTSVPLTVRSIIGKSWGQGAQHSQALHALFMHIPGLRVAMPTTPYDAKGCLIAAIRDDNPVLFIEHRLLHFQKGQVPQTLYAVEPGRSRVAVKGNDVTLVGISYMQVECLRAQQYLAEVNVHAEVIDPIWLAPLDMEPIVESAKKTGRLLVIDNGWLNCGASAEIIAQVCERGGGNRNCTVRRMGFAPATCPTTPSLEEHFYPNARTIAAAAFDLVHGEPQNWLPDEREDLKSIEFKGPF